MSEDWQSWGFGAAPRDSAPRPDYSDKERCASQLIASLQRGGRFDHDLIEAINKFKCWPYCVRSIINVDSDSTIGSSLLALWVVYGYGGSIPKGLQNDLPIYVDALRRHLPVYEGSGLTVYRGETARFWEQGIIGIAWTSNRELAQEFADNREHLGEGAGVVLQVAAPREAIIAEPSQIKCAREELEYILDPRLIVSGHWSWVLTARHNDDSHDLNGTQGPLL